MADYKVVVEKVDDSDIEEMFAKITPQYWQSLKKKYNLPEGKQYRLNTVTKQIQEIASCDDLD